MDTMAKYSGQSFRIPFYLYCPRQRAHGTQPKADRNIQPPAPGKRRSIGPSARMLASALSARTKGNGVLAGTV